jgi:DNA-binding transcriptional LysR family regulator
LRLGDLNTFLAVYRGGSVTGAARALGTSAPQVSKAIARLERQLNVVLLSRGARGVALTDEAIRLLPRVERAVSQLQHIADVGDDTPRRLTLAGPSWLMEALVPEIAGAVSFGLRALELPPAVFRAHIAENFFDVGFAVGRPALPPMWHRTNVGTLRLAVFARPGLARKLGKPPIEVARVREVPFIMPVYSIDGRFVEADDDCPLGYSERRIGHQVQTIRVALGLAARSDQLVFGPEIAARREIKAGELTEVPVKGWDLREQLTLSCNPGQVLKREHDAIVEAVRATLNERG